MNASSPVQSLGQRETPLSGFSRCHDGILSRLELFGQLPAFAAAAERARHVAGDTLLLFEPLVLQHHADEEAELFVAVLRSASPGQEMTWASAMVQRLTVEHRGIEALWKQVKPSVKAVAAGKPAELEPAAVAELVSRYQTHPQFDEQEFLPMARQILERIGNHRAALGLALPMRHAPQPVGPV